MTENPVRREDDRTMGELVRAVEEVRKQVQESDRGQRDYIKEKFDAFVREIALEFRNAEAESTRIDTDLQKHIRLSDSVMREFKTEARGKLEKLDERIDATTTALTEKIVAVETRGADRVRNLATAVLLAFVVAALSVVGYYLTGGAT